MDPRTGRAITWAEHSAHRTDGSCHTRSNKSLDGDEGPGILSSIRQV